MSDRERELQAIRDAYAKYRDSGRSRIWDVGNAGYRRIVADREEALVELLATHLPAWGGRVLDLGCGDGQLAGAAREAGLSITGWTGVDLDSAQIGDAEKVHPWAAFLAASADALPFDDSSFDVVVASMLFSSLPTAELERAAAAEVGRVLVPGGAVIWYDLRYPSPRNPAVHAMSEQRIRSLFPHWRLQLRTITLLPPLARRLAPLAGWGYSALHLIPALRSHLVGTLRSLR